MSENVENIKKDMEDNKELLNLSDKEKRVYDAAFATIENRPDQSFMPPLIPLFLIGVSSVALIVGLIYAIVT